MMAKIPKKKSYECMYGKTKFDEKCYLCECFGNGKDCEFKPKEESEHDKNVREGMVLVKEIIKELDDLYHKLPAHKVWGLSGDEVCDNCSEKAIEIIKKIFGGVKNE
jgi:hypothetical protein